MYPSASATDLPKPSGSIAITHVEYRIIIYVMWGTIADHPFTTTGSEWVMMGLSWYGQQQHNLPVLDFVEESCWR